MVLGGLYEGYFDDAFGNCFCHLLIDRVAFGSPHSGSYKYDVGQRPAKSLGTGTSFRLQKIALQLSRIIGRRLFAACDGDRGFRQRDRAWPIGSARTDVGPADFSGPIHNVGDRFGNETGPVPFVFGANGANELRFGVGQQAQRIGIERDMRPVFLAVARDALAQFATFFGGLDAHTKNLDLFGNIPFGFIDKGRHLGPAPRSPAAAVKEDDGRRRSSEDSWKFDGRAVNVFELRAGKRVADLQFGQFRLLIGQKL